MTEGIVWCPHCGSPHDLRVRFCTATGKPLSAHIHRPSSSGAARRFTPQGDPLLGRVLDQKYRVVAHLGRGAIGDVFEAENLHLGRRVAIKMVSGSTSGEAVARLRREARAIASFHHPNIRDIYDVGTMPNGQPYLVLELLVGETLRERLSRVRRLAVREAVDLFQQLLSGLHVAHTAGIVHRDLKPGNVFLVERVRCAPLVKLLDFGFALDLSGQMWRRITAAGKTCGTTHYMSPEQLRGESTGVRSDLFSVGVMMFETLAGVHPFDDPNILVVGTKILRDPIPSLRMLRRSVSPELEAIVTRTLEKDPQRRFRSALELQLALGALFPAEEAPASSSGEPLPKLSSSPPSSGTSSP